MTVIDQGSNVRSPAILRFLPLKGTAILLILDAGRAAVLTKNLDLSDRISLVESVGTASSGK